MQKHHYENGGNAQHTAGINLSITLPIAEQSTIVSVPGSLAKDPGGQPGNDPSSSSSVCDCSLRLHTTAVVKPPSPSK